MDSKNDMDRRTFIGTTSAAAAAITVVPRHVLGGSGYIPPSDKITVPIDLESVIMEGSRRLKEWEQLQRELPDLNVSLRFTSHPDARLRNINLTVEEWRVVSFVSPRNSITRIAEAINLSEFEIRRIVYGMLQAGLVELIEPKRQTSPLNGRATRGETRAWE